MSRRGFTLVELLVVAGIFSMLFAMVLNGARPSASGQVRQAAQQIASVLLSVQSKALGNPAGAGVVLEPSTTTSGSAAVTTVSAAATLPWIIGSGSLTVLTATTARVTVTPDNADQADVAHGYKVQFFESAPAAQPATAWFAFVSGTTGSGTASFRADAGQTAANTIWPQPVAGGALESRIARYPGVAESLYQFPKGVAIDLRYSGVGDDPATVWGGLAGKGAIALTFDSIGGVDTVMQQVLAAAAVRIAGREPVHPVSPVYLLVATQADVDADAALANERSMWIAVHPQTGRVSVAANVAQTAKDATALRAARAKARAQTLLGK
jgi:prepilin-type N-terminal cleavage/methylation domain-containing protein